MTRDQELYLLGMLEQHLGERQRAMGGRHLDLGTSREQHVEMIALQRRAADRHLAHRLTTGSAQPATPPLAALALGLGTLVVLALLILVL